LCATIDVVWLTDRHQCLRVAFEGEVRKSWYDAKGKLLAESAASREDVCGIGTRVDFLQRGRVRLQNASSWETDVELGRLYGVRG
jgi:hypothetical protein